MTQRTLKQVISAIPASDGDGVKINRLAGQRLHPVLNPFLMIDEINSDAAADYIGGFPEHPHRGFETITYMKAGRMRHRDHMGNEGVIESGDVQWMTAGRGVLHSEMPEQDHGLLHCFQIWLNLPAAEKMKPAAYRDLRSQHIPSITINDSSQVRVIAGNVQGHGISVQGALSEHDFSTEPLLLDVILEPNTTTELSFNPNYSAVLYVYRGEIREGVNTQQMGVFSSGEALSINAGPDGAELLVLSGKPIDEAIVQYGPFVMNSHTEIQQAMQDLQLGRFLET
ncbi:pirin family protein [Maricurvus nonylphenolicus]|uniref:pirin family protein n=1 Tax=Maricurvus nonylphenolicus TaxID=1008307 RepID=UPI0036F3C850